MIAELVAATGKSMESFQDHVNQATSLEKQARTMRWGTKGENVLATDVWDDRCFADLPTRKNSAEDLPTEKPSQKPLKVANEKLAARSRRGVDTRDTAIQMGMYE